MGVFTKWIALLSFAMAVSSVSAVNSSWSGGSDLIFDSQEGGSELSAKYSVKPSGYDNKIGVTLRVSGQGFRVKTLNNRHLVSLHLLPDGKSQVIKILDVAFIQYNKEDYVIPHRLSAEVKSISTAEDIRSFVNKLKKNSNHSSSLALDTALRHFSNKPESLLVLQASEALGEAGITGSSHPHLLPLYWFATRLPHAAKRQPRERRATGGCTRSPIGGNCLGMCGFRCYCWRFVCGDCCFHTGCYQHDRCCRRRFISTSCLLPFRFSCTRYPSYPRCIKKKKRWWG